jgi:2-C-methyl-D-erythritol 4-phosphate cytidylyltransferase
VEGGAERAVSVLNGLHALEDLARDDDWILVHDAARPCVRATDVTNLIDVATATPHGGLLATPVADTLKRSTHEGSVALTVDRHQLWRALTPQIFPYTALRQALIHASADGVVITDEASAMERAGFSPCLVQGASDNIKVTQEEDLVIVGAILAQRTAQRRESVL